MGAGMLEANFPSVPEWQQAVRARCLVPGRQQLAFPPSDPGCSIPDYLARVVQQVPDRPAIVTAGRTLTYAALYALINRTARAVAAQAPVDSSPVAILLRDPVHLVAAQLGILQAGRAYAILDRHSPAERMGRILQDTGSSLLITQTSLLGVAQELGHAPRHLLLMDTDLDRHASDAFHVPIAPDALCNLFYTSGTSGHPKGVMRSHRTNLFQALLHAVSTGLHLDDRCSLISSAGVAASIMEVYSPLLAGASLYPYDAHGLTLTHAVEWLRREGVTVFCAAVTLLRRLMEALSGPGYLPDLRLIRLAGEPLQRRDLERFQRLLSPHCILVSVYGQTETAGVTSLFVDHTRALDGDVLPAGYPLSGKRVLLLDESGAQVTAGQAGQIAVRSRYMGMGYWRQPGLTAATYRPDPDGGGERICLTGDQGHLRADGCLEVLGRIDHQVKVRGFRVELAEVEAALLALAEIREAVVVAVDDGDDRRLVAYVVAAVDPPPTVSHLRRALAAALPDFMQPAAFVFLDALPVAESGKVARRALPTPPRARPRLDSAWVAPRTPMEVAVAQAWSTVLGLDEVGIYDSFLDLGGDSLQAGRIVSYLMNEFEVELSPQDLLSAATVAAMALLLVQAQAGRMAPAEVAQMLDRLRQEP